MIRKVFCIFCLAAIFSITIAALPYNVNAADKNITINGKVYEFDEKSEYEVSSSEPVLNANALGKFSISGNILNSTEKDNISTFEVADGSSLSFTYTYDDSLMNATGTNEHLTSDNKKLVDNVELKEKIQNGAVILQTSLDGQKWTVNYKQTNVFEDTPVQAEAFYETNDIQLLNGCYYRIIVAYKTEKEIEPSKFLWADIKNYEYKKYAEVYKFYAVYRNSGESTPSDNERTFTLGEVINTGTSNGYSGSNPLTAKDPHYGWELGSFKISGFTENNDNIFLKNVDDKITLWFNFKENIDIDRLNGNDKLSIANDDSGYDQYFQTKPTDMGRGTLIIRYTDYQGVKHEPIIYTNYLEAISSASADIKVRVFEEGDYEVALDYKIKNDKFIDTYEDYRIFFTFKIRNGNCMAFPREVGSTRELKNSSVSENGFYLDLAKSRYLKINVEMARWTKGADGYTEDVRYNRPAKDGDQYTEEGIYTIKVNNPSTGENTIKKIYVGSDSVLIASMNEKNKSYTINDIAALVEQGAEIQSDGTIIPPKPPETEPPVTETETITEISETSVETVTETETTTTSVTSVVEESEEIEAIPVSAEATQNSGSSFVWIFIVIAVVAAAGGILIYMQKNKKE
ncbi:MAG: hypothetical protein HDT21_13450 [Ruminococcus sp.]|nr:hypothetical protein [Ruminococcus sp.]